MQQEQYAVIVSQQDWENIGKLLDLIYQVEELLEAVEERIDGLPVQEAEWILRALTKLVNARERLESVLGL